MRDYIIVANGDFLSREIILEAAANKVIVALDGAADKLAQLDIKPHIIAGDFDSIIHSHWNINPACHSPYQSAGVTIVPLADQNHTDLVKAIRYCDEQGASSITIVCGTGGRLDHHESAMRTLRTEYKKHRPMTLYTASQTLRFAKDETIEILGEVGDKIGLLAFPAGSFSSVGLEYEATDFQLQFGFSESISNALALPKATIIIKGEVLCMMPPQLNSQRHR